MKKKELYLLSNPSKRYAYFLFCMFILHSKNFSSELPAPWLGYPGKQILILVSWSPRSCHTLSREMWPFWRCRIPPEDEPGWCVSRWPDPGFPTGRDQTRRKSAGKPDVFSQGNWKSLATNVSHYFKKLASHSKKRYNGDLSQRSKQTQFAQLLSQAHMLKINRDHRARLASSNRESFAY